MYLDYLIWEINIVKSIEFVYSEKLEQWFKQHFQAKKRTIMFQWAAFSFFAQWELDVKTEALINFAVECQKKMLWRKEAKNYMK